MFEHLQTSMTKAVIHLRQSKEFCQALRYQQHDPIISGKLADLENILHRASNSLTADVKAVERLAGLNTSCVPDDDCLSYTQE
jgi:hypothetical protein